MLPLAIPQLDICNEEFEAEGELVHEGSNNPLPTWGRARTAIHIQAYKRTRKQAVERVKNQKKMCEGAVILLLSKTDICLLSVCVYRRAQT